MKTSRFSFGIALAAGSFLLAGCNVQEPAATTPVPEQSADAAPQEQAPEAPPAAAKVDPATAASLEAGMKVMAPRLVSQTDAYSKIEPKAFRFFMHPDQGKDAIIELDTKGLDSVTLSPYIFDFNGDASCIANTEGGIVEVLWSLDGGTPNKIMVDRNYVGLVPVQLTNSSRLKIEVNEGNGAPWCDWAGIGFIDPKP